MFGCQRWVNVQPTICVTWAADQEVKVLINQTKDFQGKNSFVVTDAIANILLDQPDLPSRTADVTFERLYRYLYLLKWSHDYFNNF
jgi:hypothetical protein